MRGIKSFYWLILYRLALLKIVIKNVVEIRSFKRAIPLYRYGVAYFWKEHEENPDRYYMPKIFLFIKKMEGR